MKKIESSFNLNKIVTVIVLLIAAVSYLGAQKISPRLTSLFNNNGEEIFHVWVKFAPRQALSQSEEKAILETMNPRQIKRRRLRSRLPIVSIYDKPLSENFLEDLRVSGAEIRHVSKWLNSVSVSVTGGVILEKIIRKPYVESISLVKRFARPEPINEKSSATSDLFDFEHSGHIMDYGRSYTQLSQIGVPELHDKGINGRGVLIAIFDTGFDLPGHESILPITIVDSWDFVNDDDDVTDGEDMGLGFHGRSVLSVIGGFKEGELIGSGYGAQYLLAKTENTNWERPVEEDDWVAGAEWAESLGADIITSSLGYTTYDEGYEEYNNYPTDLDGNTAVSTIAADMAAGLGVVVVNSAANAGDSGTGLPEHNTLGAPADGDSVIAVGAIDQFGNRISFSSVGPSADGRIKPDVMAQGYKVYAAGSSSASYTLVNGTSFSAPLTAGVVSQILQLTPSADPGEIMNLLHQTSSRAEFPDYRNGYGIVNAPDAVFYYAPTIKVENYPDTEDIAGNYEVPFGVTIQAQNNNVETLSFIYRFGDGPEFEAPIGTLIGNQSEFHDFGIIPGSGEYTNVDYRVQVITTKGDTVSYPYEGGYFSFNVAQDTIAPVISHTPIINYPLQNEIYIYADITDNGTIGKVEVHWSLNDSFPKLQNMYHLSGSRYYAILDSGSLNITSTDSISYRIIAEDAALLKNTSYFPAVDSYQTFGFTDTRGSILVINDAVDDSISVASNIALFVEVAAASGYSTKTISTIEAEDMDYSPYQMIFVSNGINSFSNLSTMIRIKISEFVDGGGGFLIEGGETARQHRSDEIGQILGIVSWYSDGLTTMILNELGTASYYYFPDTLIESLDISATGSHKQDNYFALSSVDMIYSTSGVHSVSLNKYGNGYAGIIGAHISDIMPSNGARSLLKNLIYYLNINSITEITPPADLKPLRFTLLGNYPNPFNPSTTISFILPNSGQVQLKIFSLSGRLVFQANHHMQNAGLNKIQWNGLSNSGRKVSTGTYPYELIFHNNARLFGKMTIIK